MVLLLLAGITIGSVAGYFPPSRQHEREIAAELGTPARPGPWGELYCVPFNIAAPDELLPVPAIVAGGTHWLFKDFTVSDLSRLLESAGVPSEQRTALFDPAVAHIVPSGIELTPSPEMVVELPDKGAGGHLPATRAISRKPDGIFLHP